MSKYWNAWGSDPMPEVADFFYPLAETVNAAIPDPEWENNSRPMGLDPARFWSCVTFYHIGRNSAADPHINFGKDNHDRYYVQVESYDHFDIDSHHNTPNVHLEDYLPESLFFNKDLATDILTLFAYGRRGWIRKIRTILQASKSLFCPNHTLKD